jgi:hypothetical protein
MARTSCIDKKRIRRIYTRGIQVKVMNAQQFQCDIKTPRNGWKLMKKTLIVLAAVSLVMSTIRLAAAEEKDLAYRCAAATYVGDGDIWRGRQL